MKLGIVTISFNQAKFLPAAIESVQVGDPARLSYVVVDPGSQDGSREIIERYRHRFSAVILEPDRGPADGLNKGFAAAGGDILGYLNSDDVFAPGGLDFVLDYFERNPAVDVLLGGIHLLDEAGNLKRRGRAPDKLNLRKFACGACFFWQQATFFRRSAFEKAGGFNVQNRITWDSELVVDMALAGARFGYTRTVIGHFRIHGESITGSGRHAEIARRQAVLVRQKIERAGIQLYSGRRARLEQLRYKFDPVRHFLSRFALKVPPR